MSVRKEFFEWQDAYSVNIRTLDDQHKALVDTLNHLFVAAFERKANSIVVGMLQKLQRYCQTHFELEERLLQQMSHKDAAAHRHENRMLLEQLDRLCKKHEQEDMPVYFDMLYFLKTWLVGHFRVVDSGDLVKIGIAAGAWEQSANEAFARMHAAGQESGLRKAA